jgi:hypothetical protein
MSVIARSSSTASVGYSPVSLRSAYGLAKAAPERGGSETVGIVVAYGDPDAAANLAAYRSHFGLPACTLASKCLRIVNEHGVAGQPAAQSSWAVDHATGLDVISGLCPRCRLLLVEANGADINDLGTAEDTAVADGARFVLNSWGGTEYIDQPADAHYFYHPGVAIVFAAGNGAGDQPTFPADLPYVTSVGGTTLTRSRYNTRHWAEAVWADTSSGCSTLEPKPSWQRQDASAPNGCLNRTQNDVSADANPSTGAAIYNTYGSTHAWQQVGGTGLAAAIVTAAYALAGTPERDTFPASYPYQHAKDLFDVVFGLNGECEINRQYLCNAQPGFDGPTGLGSPDGTAAFAASSKAQVTVMDPGTQDEEAGGTISVKVAGFDARAGATSLTYSATGLPAGLKVTSVSRSTDAEITGTLPPSSGTYAVRLTGKDTKTGDTATTWFSIVAAASLTPSAPITTSIATDTSTSLAPATTLCLDGGAATEGSQVTLQSCNGEAEQLWTYQSLGAPGASYHLTNKGWCLSPAASGVELAACDTTTTTLDWRLLYGGTLMNAGTGTCLETANLYEDPLSMEPCDATLGYQQWHVMTATLQSGVPGMCMAADDNGYNSSPYMIEPCGEGDERGFGFNNDGSVLTSLDRCMIGEDRRIDGAEVSSGFCDQGYAQDWLVGPGGELINEATGLCLDDPGNSEVAGTPLELEDCYGQLGEIWALG